MNDEPRSHEKLANMLLREWYGKDNPQLQELAPLAPGMAPPRQQPAGQRGPPSRAPSPGTPTNPTAGGHLPTFWQDTYGAVLEAERALLYTVRGRRRAAAHRSTRSRACTTGRLWTVNVTDTSACGSLCCRPRAC